MEKFQYLKTTELGSLPKAPGVYAFASPKTLLYIGKAQNIQERVKNHLQQPAYRDALFMAEVTKVGYLKTDSEVDALILEAQLIKKYGPKYNVMWKDDKKYFYVAVTKEKLPRVFLTHQPGSERAEYIGPFTEGKAIKRVLRLLRRVFPYYTAKKHPQIPCTWCHLGLCPGPNPDQKAYLKTIAKLKAVLKGKRSSVLKTLKKEMNKAAKVQDFERAAALRDQLVSLERIIFHASLFNHEKEPAFPWSFLEQELQKLLSTKKRIRRLEAYDISNIQGSEATGSQVTFVKGVPAKEWYRKYRIKIAGSPDDFAMIRELLSRRLKHAEWPYPDLVVIDGGKGQLSAALKAVNFAKPSLRKLGLAKLQVVALAKRQNELFFPEKRNPVLLRDLPRPLENLFLHIRDEAHRFAISYHRKLHRKAAFG